MIRINVDWKKNPTWGMNPHATLENNNTNTSQAARCSGCGYDKLSSVVASVLNADSEIKEKLSHKYYKKAPYGVYKDRGIDGGIGMPSVIRILKWLGYKVEWKQSKVNDRLWIYEGGKE